MSDWLKRVVGLGIGAAALLPASANAFFWGTKFGVASCEASVAGQCDSINDKTALYRSTSLRIVYYAPDGTYYQVESTTVVTGRWRVDETGENVILRTFGAGQFPPQPIGEFVARASDIVDGDPAALADNKRGIYLLPLRDLPTEEIIAQVRAR
ncbi:MAG: hypothetical protein AAF739_06500 [Pseudomonadota bacterium]